MHEVTSGAPVSPGAAWAGWGPSGSALRVSPAPGTQRALSPLMPNEATSKATSGSQGLTGNAPKAFRGLE